MPKDFSRILGFAAAAIALTLTVAVLVESIFRRGGGPEGAIITRLKGFERDGLVLEVPDAGTLRSSKASFQRISVALDADAEGALVTSTLDFVGTIERAALPPGSEGVPRTETRVSSLGLEKARYRKVSGEWVPEQGDAPRLLGIVRALEARRVELERGAPVLADGGIAFPEVQLPRSYRALAWYLRSEREQIEVAEDSRLIGTSPERPVDEKRTTRLSLEEDSAGLFRFPGGVM